MPSKILVFAGSLRTGSFNRQLADAAAMVLARAGADVTQISLGDYPMPLVDEDLKNEKGIPDGALKFARQLQAHDGAFIASPEYNSSIPPLLKNALDWASLAKSSDLDPFRGLTVALGAASNGQLGGIRGLYHLRSVLMNVGAQIITEQCAVSRAASAFAEDGLPENERTRSLLEATCRVLIDHAGSGRARG